jgi:chromosome segregation ATPase
MQSYRSKVVWLLVITLAGLAGASPAQAWYGHRNNRSYRSGRMNNRLAGVQKASTALAAAQSRLYAARANSARQLRQARYQAQNSSGLLSARSADLHANRDYQAARDAVVNKLKTTNPEFRDLLTQANTKRDRIAALAKSGDSPDEMQRLSGELRTVSRKVTLIEDQAVNADPTAKEIASRKPDVHSSLQAAEKAVQTAIAQDPGVQAAQKQLNQASLQAQQASARYNNALGSANSMGSYGRGYSRGRRGYGVVVMNAGYSHGSHHHHVHHAVLHRR